MKIIFLDIDGVLNNAEFMPHHRGRPSEYAYGQFVGEDYFNPHCVANLNKIVRATGAKYVLSSSWRKLFEIDTMREFFLHQRVHGELMDYTGSDTTRVRGYEIQTWLDENPGVESFVILDDDRDMEHLMPYLVHTSWAKGLEEHHVQKAIEILSEGTDNES